MFKTKKQLRKEIETLVDLLKKDEEEINELKKLLEQERIKNSRLLWRRIRETL